MSLRFSSLLPLTIVLCGTGWLASFAHGQDNAPASDEAQETARREILDSDRWLRAVRGLNEWLSVQQLYGPDEVAVLRTQFRARVEQMSPAELRDHLDNLEDKLAVLTSPQAEEARRWLGQFLAVQAMYTDHQLRQMRPDVANMTASQIRRELEQFQARRGATQRTQAAAQQGRALQVQSSQGVQSARRQAGDAARRATSTPNANAPAPATRREDLPGHSEPPASTRPYYTVGPWGNPIRWDPLAGFW